MTARVGYWIAAALWTAVIFAASSELLSAAHTGDWLYALVGHSLSPAQFATLHFVLRKAAHLTEYFVLGALLARAERGRTLVVLLLAVAVAATDEWHQSFVPSRTASGWDVLIDVVGTAIGSRTV